MTTQQFPQFRCPMCGKACATAQDVGNCVAQHVQTAANAPPPPAPKFYHCSECNRQFGTNADIKGECPYCRAKDAVSEQKAFKYHTEFGVIADNQQDAAELIASHLHSEECDLLVIIGRLEEVPLPTDKPPQRGRFETSELLSKPEEIPPAEGEKA